MTNRSRRKIDVRIDEDLIDWLDEYAAKRRWNRTQALTEMLVTFKAQEERETQKANEA